MATKFMSNISRTFSNSGFSRTYSSSPKPFHFTRLHQTNTTPLPPPTTSKLKKSHSACWTIFCCCLTGCISMLITAAIVLGITALILWLVLRPIHTPKYDVEDFRVGAFVYNPTPRSLDSQVSFIIKADNPNGKIGIKYESVDIDTQYQSQFLGTTPVAAGYYHGHRNITRFPVTIATKGLILDPTTGATLQGHIATGDIPLLLHVRARFNLKIGAITTPSYTVKVNCDVNIKPPTATTSATVLRAPTCKKV
uniref:Late embryogenesis abundant protein LEA-2 subgroup domain-containing protein n=1 Tax=Physcomitrium patens TaxID=3218 RepID=A0A2K1JP47_PHYPA|nr:NDR1/HIN1-like protein 3 [Physcomitrium patens]PNR43333.1 hypothetical protein PHYPA_015713 [Physcomitrium patens]|eukprot:XP_024391469.1 NDR1/HIN1-like protein 3 [Physcomitrella patens]